MMNANKISDERIFKEKMEYFFILLGEMRRTLNIFCVCGRLLTKSYSLVIFFIFLASCSSLDKNAHFKISDDLLVTQINDRSFTITDTAFYSTNVFVSKMPEDTVVIVSSFIDTVRTQQMIHWVKESLKPRKMVAINTHFHADGTGGNEGYTQNNIETWSTTETHTLYQQRADSMQSSLAQFVNDDRISKYVLERKNVPAQKFFEAKEGQHWAFGSEKVIAYYPGPGHTEDNIVIYFPNQKILFGGCLLRALSWNSLGNTEDANIKKYYESVKNLLQFEATIVIPGHGEMGGKNIINHTMDMAKAAKNAL